MGYQCWAGMDEIVLIGNASAVSCTGRVGMDKITGIGKGYCSELHGVSRRVRHIFAKIPRVLLWKEG